MLWVALFFTILQLATACRGPESVIFVHETMARAEMWTNLADAIVELQQARAAGLLPRQLPPIQPTKPAAPLIPLPNAGYDIPSDAWIGILHAAIDRYNTRPTCEDWIAANPGGALACLLLEDVDPASDEAAVLQPRCPVDRDFRISVVLAYTPDLDWLQAQIDAGLPVLNITETRPIAE